MTDWQKVCASTHLLHILTCGTCRDLAIEHLLDEQSSPLHDEDTKEEICTGAWDAGITSEAVEFRLRRREAVEDLFAELMGASAVGRLRLLGTAPFQNRDLLDRLLEESHAGQPTNPAGAAELARLAARLASTFQGEGEDDAAAALSRALLAPSAGGEVPGRGGARDA